MEENCSRKRWKWAGFKSKGTEFMCREHWMTIGNSNSSFADLSSIIILITEVLKGRKKTEQPESICKFIGTGSTSGGYL